MALNNFTINLKIRKMITNKILIKLLKMKFKVDLFQGLIAKVKVMQKVWINQVFFNKHLEDYNFNL